MKNLLIITMAFLCNLLFSQTDQKIKYSASAVYLEFINAESLKSVSKIPEGQSAELTYDTFFKKWKMSYIDASGTKVGQVFTYIQDTELGFMKMKDSYGHIYTIVDHIALDGTLIAVSEKITENGLIASLVFEKIIRQK